MNFRSLSIPQKISLSLIILILGYLISMISFFVNGRQAELRLQHVSGDFFSATRYSQHAAVTFDDQIISYEEAVLLGDEEHIQTAQVHGEEVETKLTEIISLESISSTSRQQTENMLASLQEFMRVARPVYTQMTQGGDNPDILEQAAALGKQSSLLLQQLEQAEQDAADELKTEIRAIGESIKTQRLRNLYIFLAVVCTSLSLSFFILIKYLIRPLDNTVVMMRDIAEGEGDLTRRLDIASRDEIGELSKWFNYFIKNIQSIIKAVAGNSAQLEKASSVLTSTSEKLSTGAGELTKQTTSTAALSKRISEHVHNVSQAAENMSNNAGSIARSASETSTNVSSVAAAVEEMNATISEVARSCAKAQELAGKGSEESSSVRDEIAALNEAAQEIGTIIDIISKITEQVNLLALNATIEAASAGDAGRGFAVVANEIKELARQTVGATEGISSSIQAIQGKTAAALKSINKVSEANRDVNEITISIAASVEEQSMTTTEISSMVSNAARNVEDVSSKVNDLTTNISQNIVVSISDAASGLGEVSGSVQAMEGVAQNTVTAVADIDEACGNLSLLASQLKLLVNKFKLK